MAGISIELLPRRTTVAAMSRALGKNVAVCTLVWMNVMKMPFIVNSRVLCDEIFVRHRFYTVLLCDCTS